MTQEQKDLLLKDISARLPYKVKVEIKNICKIGTLEEIDCSWEEMSVAVSDEKGELNGYDFYLAKPYLFPLSSMTEEQKEEFDRLYTYDALIVEPQWKLIDFCNKHHLDYRGLIPMDLAINATGLDIYKS